VGAGGLGTYAVRVDRSGLAPGTYQTRITVDSTANQAQVSVIMQVSGGSDGGGNVGNHFVLLIDADTSEVVAQDEPGVVADRVRYRFDDVAPGRYVIIAGTDHDDDGFICDLAEACGAFPILDPLVLPEVVLQGSRDDLDFSSAFSGSVVGGAAATADIGAGSLGGLVLREGIARLRRGREDKSVH
jgi:serine protease